MATVALPAEMGRKSWLDRLMSLAAEVRPGEAVTALLLIVNVFLLLGAYYIIKPVREALISGSRAAEIASYSGAVQAGLLLFLVPAYGSVASRVSRIRLINVVTCFFVSNMVLFFLLNHWGVRREPLGIAFYLWLGIFSVMVIAQFWAFANDLYSPGQGKRLFAIVGIGSLVGSMAGSRASEMLVKYGIYTMILISAGVLLVCLALTNLIHHREKGRLETARRAQVDAPLSSEGGFQLVLQHRYLLFIGLLVLLDNFINTNGEFVWRRTVNATAAGMLREGTAGGLSQEQLVAGIYGNFQFWQNLLGAVIQFFLVSRIFKYIGVRGALFILPLTSLCSYSLIAAVPVFSFIRLAKVVENSTDYSLQNTVRHALFLPTSREAKYKAKQVVDSFFWRFGDMTSALAVYLGLKKLPTANIAAVNIAVVLLWVLLAYGIAREHRKLASERA